MESPTELIQSTYNMGYAEAKEVLLRAADLAAAENDVDTEFEARMHQVRLSHNDPDGRATIANYGWCLARHDEDPQRFPVSLWYYKWIIPAAGNFAAISREQIAGLLDDLEERFRRENASEAAVLKLRVTAAAAMGDLDVVAALHPEWEAMTSRASRVAQNDCRACDEAHSAEMWTVLGDYEAAIDAGQSLLDGRGRCASEPHYAFAYLSQSLRRLGDSAQASEVVDRGLALTGTSTQFMRPIGHYARQLVLLGDAERAESVAQGVDPSAGSPRSQFELHRSQRLVDLAHGRPDATPAAAIAAAFDERNGNRHVSSLLSTDETELAQV